MTAWLQNIWARVRQYLILGLSFTTALLALLLKFKALELRRAQIQLLDAHVESQRQIAQAQIDNANDAFAKSQKRLNDAISLFHNTHE